MSYDTLKIDTMKSLIKEQGLMDLFKNKYPRMPRTRQPYIDFLKENKPIEEKEQKSITFNSIDKIIKTLTTNLLDITYSEGSDIKKYPFDVICKDIMTKLRSSFKSLTNVVDKGSVSEVYFLGKDLAIKQQIVNEVVKGLNELKFVKKINKFIVKNGWINFIYVHGLYRCQEKNNTQYDLLVMETVQPYEYKNLNELIKSGDKNKIFSIIAQTLMSIACLLYRQMVHCDIHGENIMVSKTSLQTIQYNIGGNIVNIQTHGVCAKLIDYGFSSSIAYDEEAGQLQEKAWLTNTCFRKYHQASAGVLGGTIQPLTQAKLISYDIQELMDTLDENNINFPNLNNTSLLKFLKDHENIHSKRVYIFNRKFWNTSA